jgi:hypothetical protein
MIETKLVPLQVWPGKKTESWAQKRAVFRSTFQQTLDLMDRELRMLGAKEILIQAYCGQEDIRLSDGWLKSSARPKQPGIILTFKKKDGRILSMPCDRFNKYEDNLRAIALSLEALRSVDRYGVTQTGEQYKGWEALPPPGAQAVGDTYNEKWAKEIIRRFGNPYCPPMDAPMDVWEKAANAARFNTHPDKKGKAADFDLVQRARGVLGL